jgi:hypothetical protein
MSSFANLTPIARMDVLDCAAELCDPMDWSEPRTFERRTRSGRTMVVTERHITHHASLLDQLSDAIEPTSVGGDGTPRPYASRPVSRIEAIDAFLRIDHDSAAWVRRLGDDDPADTAACVRRVVALAARETACSRRHIGCCTVHDIEADVRRWWSWARILTGWDTPPWRPDNTCPLCAVRGSLRVRLAQHAGLCVDCWSTWGHDTIGLLADHIRAENATDLPRQRPDLATYGLCPTCGAPRIARERRDGLTPQFDLTCPNEPHDDRTPSMNTADTLARPAC